MDWTATHITPVLKTHPFTVEEVALHDAKLNRDVPHPFHRLATADWVNVLPITTEGKAVLIRQPRVGAMADILETPGGTLDEGEKDPTLAAARELEEETGYTSQRFLSLGTINPNPALMTNRIHMFVALGCVLNPQRKHFPDELERIAVELVDATELESLVRFGRINHALAALVIMLAGKYVKIHP